MINYMNYKYTNQLGDWFKLIIIIEMSSYIIAGSADSLDTAYVYSYQPSVSK